MSAGHLIQTRLPPDLAARVNARAAAEGLSESAWIRRLVIDAINEDARVDQRSLILDKLIATLLFRGVIEQADFDALYEGGGPPGH